MNLLAIESVTDTVGASVLDDAGRCTTSTLTGMRRHAETMAPAIAEVLERAGVSLRSLDAIAVDVGPGLFTGLRVGVATAKGLAQGLGVGLLALTSLEILAAGAFESGWSGTALAVVDGRRAEVFSAHYGPGQAPGELVELVPGGRHRPERVSIEAMADGDRPVLACGDGALRYRELFEASSRVHVSTTPGYPDPAVLARLAATRIEAGAALVGATELEPRYLRDADARINWVQRAPAVRRGA
ncbi:MAG: tRNA (adenosine(37)-N6)-threonylcarbamoyltransferase complex dimerization subunit type 1 TsaB [Acidimicrobiales bacterium]